jgi:hypothetical protein
MESTKRTKNRKAEESSPKAKVKGNLLSIPLEVLTLERIPAFRGVLLDLEAALGKVVFFIRVIRFIRDIRDPMLLL